MTIDADRIAALLAMCRDGTFYQDHDASMSALAAAEARLAKYEALEAAAYRAIEAFRLTREYVGEGLLPALPGWSWYDADEALQAALAALHTEVK